MTAPAHSLPPYPAYRPAGVEWLDEVPAHWEVRRLKYWVGINEQTLSEKTDPSFEFHYLEIGAVGTGTLVDEPPRIRFANAPSRARRVVHAGDTIISTVRTYLKAVWFAENLTDAMICSTGFAVLTPRAETAPKFVSYLAQSNYFTNRITAESEGIAYPAIAERKLAAIHIPVPPPDEQAAIASYLDHAVDRINRARQGKTRLAELLQEYRHAAIHHAVTRGLNPDAPLKPSGVKWLDDVPAHWEVRRLKTICRLAYGNSLPAARRVPGDTPVYGSNGLVGYHTIPNTDGQCIIIGRKGSFGKVHYSDQSAFAIDTAFFVDQRYTSANIRWLYYLLGWLQLDAFSKDSAVPGLNRNDAYQHIGLLPPPDEQAAIAAHLDQLTAKLDAAIAGARQSAALLDEYRAALIAAAVTGQVDVRAAAGPLTSAG